MKNSLYTFAFLLCLSYLNPVMGQDGYKTAAGGRLGSPLSASIKHFVSEKSALEAYVGASWWFTGYSTTSVNAAYLIHESLDIEDFEGLRYYYGGGAGVQFWNYNNNFVDPGDNTSFSVSGYVGLDYYFEDTPVNVSIDWRPTFLLGSTPFNFFRARYGSIAVRYILK
ncbi:MAG: hypothetical protein AB8F74_06945 [Saprospiraceae bacterium]